MKIEPMAQNSLVNRVAERIRLVIEQGQMRAGDRLPTETELTAQLQVSRSVLREAIGRLETLGLLTVRRGRGMFVGDRDSLSNCAKLVRSAMSIAPRELLQFAELRRALECHAARRAAERAGPEDVAELEALCAEIDRDGQDDLAAMRVDFQFHHRLVELTGNELMRNVLGVIQEFVMAGMHHTTPRPRNRVESRRVHRAVVDAVRARDPDAAERAMQVHMDYVDLRLREAEERRRHEADHPPAAP